MDYALTNPIPLVLMIYFSEYDAFLSPSSKKPVEEEESFEWADLAVNDTISCNVFQILMKYLSILNFSVLLKWLWYTSLSLLTSNNLAIFLMKYVMQVNSHNFWEMLKTFSRWSILICTFSLGKLYYLVKCAANIYSVTYILSMTNYSCWFATQLLKGRRQFLSLIFHQDLPY